MISGIKIKLLIFVISLLCIGCKEEKTLGLKNIYKTEVNVYYSAKARRTYTFYTEHKVDMCSFDGTNYLIENERNEELFSSTAPIEIVKQSQFDNDGKETECENNYYRGSN